MRAAGGDPSRYAGPVDVASFRKETERFDVRDLPETERVLGTDAAYIMYTSGSTGVPKGAVMTHRNVLNLIDWSRTTYSITPADVVTNLNPLFFDNSVFDAYSALFNGACLAPFSADEVRDPGLLVRKVDALQCTLWFSVPSLLIFLQTMKATDGKRLGSIRRFIFGGEGYPKAKLKQLFDAYHRSADFYNVYGPTECTCICSSYRITPEDFSDIQGLPSLGSLAPNFGGLILDGDQEVSPGEAGELCLIGPQVGAGYYNDPVRTALAFGPIPRRAHYQQTMYRTGDLVRLDPHDGKLHFKGRKDNQIKHMGYRIELEEIESALYCLSYVSEAAALHSDARGGSRIVAAVVLKEDIADDRIVSDLRSLIPEYMLPSKIIREPSLPKNANGKVDRRLLVEKHIE